MIQSEKTQDGTRLQQLSLWAGSRDRANHSHLPVKEKVQKTLAISGRKCLESFGKFNRNGLWGRTFSELLIGTGEWYSTRCKLTWKLKGTKFNRMYFQLQVSTLRTEGTEFGLWDISRNLMGTPRVLEIPRSEKFLQKEKGVKRVPTPSEYIRLLKTPCTADAYSENLSKKEQKFGNSGTLAQEVQSGFVYQRCLLPTPQAMDCMTNPPRKISETGRIVSNQGHDGSAQLKDLAMNGLLPTPTAMDSTGATANMKSTQVKEGSMHSVTLSRFVNGMLPTPTADDCPAKNTGKRNQDGLQKRAFQQTGQTSQLSVLFTLEMMGFPTDWLVLPFRSGETKE